jgi:hypothetical protein
VRPHYHTVVVTSKWFITGIKAGTSGPTLEKKFAESLSWKVEVINEWPGTLSKSFLVGASEPPPLFEVQSDNPLKPIRIKRDKAEALKPATVRASAKWADILTNNIATPPSTQNASQPFVAQREAGNGGAGRRIARSLSPTSGTVVNLKRDLFPASSEVDGDQPMAEPNIVDADAQQARRPQPAASSVAAPPWSGGENEEGVNGAVLPINSNNHILSAITENNGSAFVNMMESMRLQLEQQQSAQAAEILLIKDNLGSTEQMLVGRLAPIENGLNALGLNVTQGFANYSSQITEVSRSLAQLSASVAQITAALPQLGEQPH